MDYNKFEFVTENSSISVSIPNHLEKQINKKSVNFYTIEVIDHFISKKWKIDKRYSEFKELHNEINKLFVNCPKLPASTTRFAFISYDSTDTCRCNLEVYLKECMNRSDISNSSQMVTFLEV